MAIDEKSRRLNEFALPRTFCVSKTCSVLRDNLYYIMLTIRYGCNGKLVHSIKCQYVS